MMIAARNAFLMSGEKLPYDAEVEYLESTGTQYIDTGYNFVSTTDSVYLRFQLTTTQQYRWIFGAYDTAQPQHRLGLSSGGSSRYRTVAYNTSAAYTTDAYFSGSPHDFSATPEIGARIDANTFFAYSGYATVSNINLFRVPSAGAIAGIARIYSYRHARSGANLHDFIPVRVGSGSSAVGYLYDKANPTGGPLGNGLYGNAADGQGGVTGFAQFGADK